MRANRLEGLGGNDMLDGGLGNDVYVFNADSNLGLDTLSDSDGVDLLDFSQTENRGIRINLGLTTSQVVTPSLSIQLANGASFESLIGSRSHDTMVGNNLANTFIGNQGNDSFSGGDGMIATCSIRRMHLETIPLVTQGDRLDFLQYDDGRARHRFQPGHSTTTNGQQSSVLMLTSGTAIENLTGSSLNDFLVGNSLANTLVGGPGEDSLDGKSGNDLYVFDGDLALGLDNIWDSSGIDTISFASTSGKEVTLDLGLTAIQGVTRTLSLEIPPARSSRTLLEDVRRTTSLGTI